MSLTAALINKMLKEHWPGARTECTAIGADHAEAEIQVHSDDIRPGEYISGPTQFACADAAFWFMVAGALGYPEPMALTSELSIRFLRPAKGEWVHARAELIRKGKRTIVGSVTVWSESPDRPCAVAQGTYSLPIPNG